MSMSSRLGERELRSIRAAPPCPALAATTLQHSSLEFSPSPAACRKRSLSLSLSLSLLICNLNWLILWALLPTVVFYVVVLIRINEISNYAQTTRACVLLALARNNACINSLVSSTITFVGGNLLVCSLSSLLSDIVSLLSLFSAVRYC